MYEISKSCRTYLEKQNGKYTHLIQGTLQRVDILGQRHRHFLSR